MECECFERHLRHTDGTKLRIVGIYLNAKIIAGVDMVKQDAYIVGNINGTLLEFKIKLAPLQVIVIIDIGGCYTDYHTRITQGEHLKTADG